MFECLETFKYLECFDITHYNMYLEKKNNSCMYFEQKISNCKTNFQARKTGGNRVKSLLC